MLTAKKEFEINMWPEVYASRQNRSILTWPVTGVEESAGKLCLVVSQDRVKGLIPLEESGVQTTDNPRFNKTRLNNLIGQEVSFIVISTDKKHNLFIASRAKAMVKLSSVSWDKLQVGFTKTAIARRIVHRTKKDGTMFDMGAVVEIDGIEAFLPVQEIAYGWVGKVLDFIQPGDVFDVKIIEINKEKPKMLVSVKALYENPWPECLKRYSKGSTYAGIVTGIAEYGIFVNLEPGVDILCNHPKSGRLNKGDQVATVITRISEDQKINGVIARVIRRA